MPHYRRDGLTDTKTVPELPEVETTRRGIEPFVVGRTVRQLIVRQCALRWPVPDDLPELVAGQTVQGLARRGKYLLLRLGAGTVIIHLGMSGSLRLCAPGQPPRKHDHVDLVVDQDLVLRFHDPRRFGCWLWSAEDPSRHPLLAGLGPEPFDATFSGDYLHAISRQRSSAVKALIMDHRVVVGVGNIYANEALFRAGIDPRRSARRIAVGRYRRLAGATRAVLEDALAAGGTTLRDFVNEQGSPGYFQQTLSVYGRAGELCRRCGATIKALRLGQRSTFYCPRCQR